MVGKSSLWIKAVAGVYAASAVAASANAGLHATSLEGAASAGSEADCLSLAIYYEARSEPEAGQQAVAQVVLNRVRDPAYPDDVCSVVFQGSERRTGCQFSFTCDGSMARLPEGRAWAQAREIAAAALSGRMAGPVGAATHYHTRAILPYWASSLSRVTTIGAHIFYQRPSASPFPRLSFERVEQVVLAATDDLGTNAPARRTVNVHRGGASRSR